MRCLTAIASAAALAIALPGCGEEAPEQRSLPPGTVAVIGTDEITKKDLAREMDFISRAQPAPDGPELREQALARLMETSAYEQEARRRGVEVKRSDVLERWRELAPEEHKDKKLMRLFLGKLTKRELLADMRRPELYEHILTDVNRKAGGGKRGRKAMIEFQSEFAARWRSKAGCKGGRRCPRASVPADSGVIAGLK